MLWQIRLAKDSNNDFIVSSCLEHDEAIQFLAGLRDMYPEHAYYLTGLYNNDYKEVMVKYLEDCHSKSQAKCRALEEVTRMRTLLNLDDSQKTTHDKA
jgi:hypothetical protein